MQIDLEHQQQLEQSIRAIRRAMWRETLLGMLGHLGTLDLSFTQFATMLYLEAEDEASLTEIAALLARSLATTSRIVDALVRRGFIVRQEDARDRRVKRLRLSDEGYRFIAVWEQGRVEAQLAVMQLLSPEERSVVARSMDLLAQVISRRVDHERNQHGETPRQHGAGTEVG